MTNVCFWVLMLSIALIYLCINSFIHPSICPLIFRDQDLVLVQISLHNHSLHHRVCLQDIHHLILAMEVQCSQVLWDMYLHQHSRVS
jgi:hypothetical protein